MWAERICALYLQAKGYRVLKRRYRTPVGEIDFIACKGGTVVFVEVKFRTGKTEVLEAVTPLQMRRIRRAAALFAARNPRWAKSDQRFDVVTLSPWTLPKHVKNAW